MPDHHRSSDASPPAPAADLFGPTERFPPSGGELRVFCGGALVFGPQPHRFAVTLCLLLVPFIVMAASVFRYSPWPLILAATLCFAGTIAMLVRVASADPGVVPRRVLAVDVVVPSFDNVRINRHPPAPPPAPAAPPKPQRSRGDGIATIASASAGCCSTTSVVDDANDSFMARVKFCYTCQRYRGPRTFHCADCDRCIDLYDHHCPWIGTCVGAFNYAYFLWFVTFLQATIAVTFATCIYVPYAHSVDAGIEMSHALQDMGYIPVLMLVYMFALGTPSSVLTWFHYYLVCRGQLTIEHLRRTYETEPNPYDRGCVTNCGRFCGDVDVVGLADNFREYLERTIKAARDKWVTVRQPPPKDAAAPSAIVASAAASEFLSASDVNTIHSLNSSQHNGHCRYSTDDEVQSDLEETSRPAPAFAALGQAADDPEPIPHSPFEPNTSATVLERRRHREHAAFVRASLDGDVLAHDDVAAATTAENTPESRPHSEGREGTYAHPEDQATNAKAEPAA